MKPVQPLSDEPALMRYSCDFCREKKLKCSRELPKCSSCRPWPGECVYSRVAKQHRFDASMSTGAKRTQHPLILSKPTVNAASDVNTRLDRIEDAVDKLTAAINNLAQQKSHVESFHFTDTPKCESVGLHNSSILNSKASLSEPTPTPISLDEASRQLHQVRHLNTPVMQDTASQTLSDLSRAMTSVELKGPFPTGNHMQFHEGFFVPTKAVGYTLMSKYVNTMELADFMSIQPSDDLLHQVVFRPQSVSQSAWIINVNFICYVISLNDPELSSLAHLLRKNVRLALDDANIYLLPAEINIQALLLLATHGDEFALPNLSWILLGHACRQAQALGLHIPTTADSATKQRQLSLFWSLFMVDKSCSIAFGRPCLLSTSVYKDIELPSTEHLRGHRPHLDPSQSTRQSSFGGHFFSQSIELAKLSGEILEQTTRDNSIETLQNIQTRLDACRRYSNRLLADDLDAELPECTPKELEELSLGIKTIEFQYLHYSILLKQRQNNRDSACLALAREALHLLPGLLSNWKNVYNGPTWQLLYYPFTPFLIVFHQVTNSSGDISRAEDLVLLQDTVSYFEHMVAQVEALADIASKLAITARAFTTLAQSIEGQPQQQQSKPRHSDISWQGIGNIDTAILDNTSVESLLELLPGASARSTGEKRTFNTAFDWFSWEAFINDDSAL